MPVSQAMLAYFEENDATRDATVLGLVGAGGLGLEITTAFHLFEYQEASALILVVIALVGCINLIGARVRARLLALDAPASFRKPAMATA